MRNALTCFVIVALLIGSVAAAARAANPFLKGCIVSAKRDVQISAQQSGVLVKMIATRGMRVAATEKNERGETVATRLAQLDDTQQQAAARVAYTQLEVAHEEAANDVNPRYSRKAAEVAKAELNKVRAINHKIPGSISHTEVERLRLTAERSVLQIEQAEMDQRIAGKTEKVRYEEYLAAMTNIDKRVIRAPFEGIVEEIYRQQGEYVREGDLVMRLIRPDELKVEGFVSAADFNPSEIVGCKVEVTFSFARDETRTFNGKIAFVSTEIQAGGDYGVSADVTNVKENGVWVILPGSRAEMTIMVD